MTTILSHIPNHRDISHCWPYHLSNDHQTYRSVSLNGFNHLARIVFLAVLLAKSSDIPVNRLWSKISWPFSFHTLLVSWIWLPSPSSRFRRSPDLNPQKRSRAMFMHSHLVGNVAESCDGLINALMYLCELHFKCFSDQHLAQCQHAYSSCVSFLTTDNGHQNAWNTLTTSIFLSIFTTATGSHVLDSDSDSDLD